MAKEKSLITLSPEVAEDPETGPQEITQPHAIQGDPSGSFTYVLQGILTERKDQYG